MVVDAGPQLSHGPKHGHHRDGAPDALPSRDGRAAAIPRARRERRREPRAAEHSGTLAHGDRVLPRAAPPVGARAHRRAARAGKRERRRKVRLCSLSAGTHGLLRSILTRRFGTQSLRGYLTKYDCSSGQFWLFLRSFCSGPSPYQMRGAADLQRTSTLLGG